MTSGNYLSRGIKENVRRNFYLVVLLTLALLAVLPVGAIMGMDNARYMQAVPGELLPLQSEFIRWAGPQNVALMLVVIASGLVLGIAQFGYLYSGEKTDFYHSLPLKREELFSQQYLSGAICFLAPYLVSTVLLYMVGTAYGSITKNALAAMAAALAANTIYFLVFYTLAAFSALLTGNLFMGVLGYAGFLSFGVLVYEAYNELNIRFFATLPGFGRRSWFGNYCSPVLPYIRLGNYYGLDKTDPYVTTFDKFSVMGTMIYGIILLAVLLCVCVIVYRRRPSEGFQKAVAFPKLQPVIKILVVPLFAVLLSLVFSSGMAHRFFWLVACTAMTAIVLSGILEFLYHLDIKKCLKPKVSTGIALAVPLLIIAGYRMDVMGVDTYLPDKDKIETMSVYIDNVNDSFEYPNEYNLWGPMMNMDKNRIKDFDAAYELAEMGVAFCKKNREMPKDSQPLMRTSETATAMAVSSQEMVAETGEDVYLPVTNVSVYIAYHLKSGKDVYRWYNMPETASLTKKIGEVYDNWEYREKVLPTTYEDISSIDYLYADNFFESKKQVDLDAEGIRNLYKTYKTELESMTFEARMKENIIGWLEVEDVIKNNRGENYTASYKLPIFTSFDKTRQALEKAGRTIPEAVSPDQVESIELSRYDYENHGDKPAKKVFKNPKELETILKYLTFDTGSLNFGKNLNYDIVVKVNWKDKAYYPQENLTLRNQKEMKGILEQLKFD